MPSKDAANPVIEPMDRAFLNYNQATQDYGNAIAKFARLECGCLCCHSELTVARETYIKARNDIVTRILENVANDLRSL